MRSGVRLNPNSVRWTVPTFQAGIPYQDIVKYTPPNSPLRNTGTMFLETGNSNSGLIHITQGHLNDFRNKAGVGNTEEISNFIHSVVRQGKNYPHTIKPAKGGGVVTTYKINHNAYLNVVTASNGYIVTSWMSSSG